MIDHIENQHKQRVSLVSTQYLYNIYTVSTVICHRQSQHNTDTQLCSVLHRSVTTVTSESHDSSANDDGISPSYNSQFSTSLPIPFTWMFSSVSIHFSRLWLSALSVHITLTHIRQWCDWYDWILNMNDLMRFSQFQSSDNEEETWDHKHTTSS